MAETINTIEALNWALDDAMAANRNVVLFGEEVGDAEGGGIMKVSAGLSTKYGQRVRSTPISEMAFTGAAVGAAIVGMRPVIEIMLMNFVAVCMDQITNHAAKLRFIGPGGALHVARHVQPAGSPVAAEVLPEVRELQRRAQRIR